MSLPNINQIIDALILVTTSGIWLLVNYILIVVMLENIAPKDTLIVLSLGLISFLIGLEYWIAFSINKLAQSEFSPTTNRIAAIIMGASFLLSLFLCFLTVATNNAVVAMRLSEELPLLFGSTPSDNSWIDTAILFCVTILRASSLKVESKRFSHRSLPPLPAARSDLKL